MCQHQHCRERERLSLTRTRVGIAAFLVVFFSFFRFACEGHSRPRPSPAPHCFSGCVLYRCGSSAVLLCPSLMCGDVGACPAAVSSWVSTPTLHCSVSCVPEGELLGASTALCGNHPESPSASMCSVQLLLRPFVALCACVSLRLDHPPRSFAVWFLLCTGVGAVLARVAGLAISP